MKSRLCSWVLLSLTPLLAASVSLDQARLHSLYFAGQIDAVVAEIESFRAAHAAYGRSDSLFIDKYLGVVYSARPDARSRGETFLSDWIAKDPAADIQDMYANEEVDAVFQKLKAGSKPGIAAEKKPQAGGTESAPAPDAAASPISKTPVTAPPSPDRKSVIEPSKRKIKPWIWIALGGGTAAGVVTYLVLADSHNKSAEPNPDWNVRVDPSP